MLQRSWKVIVLITVLALTLGAGPALVSAQTAVTQEAAEEPGVVLVAVVPGGPAASAGLMRGDILLTLDGQEVNSQAELVAVLQANQPGDRVEATFQRGGAERRARITLGDRNGQAFLGVTPAVAAVEEAAEESTTPPAVPTLTPVVTAGALIGEVVADSPAEAAGLEVGDIVVAVDGTKLDADNSLADLIGSYSPGDEVVLQLTRDDEELEVTATLGENPDSPDKAFLGVRYGAAVSSMTDLRQELEKALEEGQIPEDLLEQHAPLLDQLQRGEDKGFDWNLPLPQDMPFGHMFPFWNQMLQGVVVSQVSAGSPADEAGLLAGDIITAVDDTDVNTAAELAAALADHKPKDRVTLTVQRSGEDGSGDESIEVAVTLGQRPDDAAKAYLGVRLGRGMRLRLGAPELPQLPKLPQMDQGSSSG